MATYLIAHTPRTGSNWLCEVLAATGQAGIGHVNRAGLFIGYGPAIADQYPENIERYFSDSTTPNGVCGTKSDWSYLHDHIERYLPAGALDAIMGRFTHFILLQRRDFFAQAVSLYIASQSGVYTSVSRNQPDKGDPTKITFDGDAITKNVTRVLTENLEWRAYFRRRNIQPLELFYEDMAADMPGTIQQVFEFLGVPPPDYIPAEVTLKRQVNPLKEQFIEKMCAGYGDCCDGSD